MKVNGIYDEETLIKKFQQMNSGNRGNLKVRQEIIEHNIPLVIYIAKRYTMDYYKRKELISIGTIGLIKAVDTFNMNKGIKFNTYAGRCIKNEILMDYRKNKKYKKDISLNTPIKKEKNGQELLVEDIFEDFEHDFVSEYEDQAIYKEIREFVEKLPERDKYIIMMSFGFIDDKIMTQKELAEKLGLSQSYISRRIKKVLKKLSIHLKRIEEGEISKKEEQSTALEKNNLLKMKVLSSKNRKII